MANEPDDKEGVLEGLGEAIDETPAEALEAANGVSEEVKDLISPRIEALENRCQELETELMTMKLSSILPTSENPQEVVDPQTLTRIEETAAESLTEAEKLQSESVDAQPGAGQEATPEEAGRDKARRNLRLI